MMNSGCDLPEHVLFDLLLRLPVASLLRFKSVCKAWFALIGSSSFITEHLKCSNNTGNALIVHAVERIEGSKAAFMLHGREYQKCFKLDHMLVLLESNVSCDHYRLVGCCDGIVCVRTADPGNLALCNPAMKQIRYLPRPLFPTPSDEEVSRFNGWVYGFGFDFKTNDYKVVRVLCYANEPWSDYTMTTVEVYSKRANSWRSLHRKDTSLVFKHINEYPQATNLYGACFWIGRGLDFVAKLVSFDLSDEVFGMMSLPGGNFRYEARGLDILNDKIVYMKDVELDSTCFSETGDQSSCRCYYEHERRSCLYERGYTFFEIWMLGEFGVDGSWNKIYRIGPIFLKLPQYYNYYCGDCYLYFRPIRLSKNGESVVLISDDRDEYQMGELHSYNLRIQDNQLPLIFSECYRAREVFHYRESLVSV